MLEINLKIELHDSSLAVSTSKSNPIAWALQRESNGILNSDITPYESLPLLSALNYAELVL